MDSFLAVVASWVLVWGITWVFVEPGVLPESVNFANSVCENNGGWKMIEEGNNIDATVYCKNGAAFDYNPAEINKNEHI